MAEDQPVEVGSSFPKLMARLVAGDYPLPRTRTRVRRRAVPEPALTPEEMVALGGASGGRRLGRTRVRAQAS